MKRNKIICAAILLLATAGIEAPTVSFAAQSDSGLEAALAECAGSVAKDSNGRPERTAMDACMSAKGFTKPNGPPPGGEHHGQGEHGQGKGEPPKGPPPTGN